MLLSNKIGIRRFRVTWKRRVASRWLWLACSFAGVSAFFGLLLWIHHDLREIALLVSYGWGWTPCSRENYYLFGTLERLQSIEDKWQKGARQTMLQGTGAPNLQGEKGRKASWGLQNPEKALGILTQEFQRTYWLNWRSIAPRIEWAFRVLWLKPYEKN